MPGTPRRHRIHVFVSGKVQGVYFREACRAEAELWHVSGWVQNLEDGRVEAVFDGEHTAVDHMLAWCRAGPPQATVRHVEVLEEVPAGVPGSVPFEVRRSPR